MRRRGRKRRASYNFMCPSIDHEDEHIAARSTRKKTKPAKKKQAPKKRKK